MSTIHSADPAVALIGERCYNVLVYDFDVTNVECLKYALSKGLGLGIVLGGGIVKIPQILETVSYGISLAYASRNKFPFSTYGENLFLTIQNVIITLLIVGFSGSGGGQDATLGGMGRKPLSRGQSNTPKVVGGLVLAASTGAVLWSENLCPPGIRKSVNVIQLIAVSILQAATLPLSLLSKAPQIITNHTNRSTGNLSAFAVFNALLGCLARLFTTKQEVNDPLIFWGFAGAALLNAVLAVQMAVYWNSGAEKDVLRRKSVETVAGSPIKPGYEEGVGRKYARKLD